MLIQLFYGEERVRVIKNASERKYCRGIKAN